MTTLGSFPDYMIKKIFDRSPGLRATIGGRVSPEGAAIHHEIDFGGTASGDVSLHRSFRMSSLSSLSSPRSFNSSISHQHAACR